VPLLGSNGKFDFAEEINRKAEYEDTETKLLTEGPREFQPRC
jgi:hypothetical protein